MKKHEGWFWDFKTQDFYRWENLPVVQESPHVDLWKHFCKRENAWMGIEKGKMCNRCGETENSS